MKDAQEAEVRINLAREDYRPVAARGSVLYFCITDLAMLSPMYVRSLPRFKSIFTHCIERARPARDLDARLQSIIEFLTSHLHARIERGLLEHHKLLFTFLVATNIARQGGKVDDAEWNFLLYGGTAQKSTLLATATAPTFLTTGKSWSIGVLATSVLRTVYWPA